ncbi:hypothetical protein NEF87_000532 [Candidatus Lokiarchaeum ossiferum]|uniref:2-oxoacid dehydrogenase acyltransferase catalytic domain-containing protein n=1 Tax=Candidatus Lokiarchaeum ossiferum TaxID=2951803 RepID=A0ABY6HMZ6_9ARCH|nr:hypothetical protein NEF87_000532 [Candidatus Lokiarchaeum sp. B-35]
MSRYDATRVKNIPSMKILEPHVMKTRDESVAYFRIQLDVTNSLEFLEKYNADHNLDKTNRLTFFHIFLTACTRSFAMYPQMNRFILGRQFWQRNRIQFSFLVKKQLKYKAKETVAKIDFDPFDTVDTVRERIHKYVNKARSEKGSEADSEMNFFGKLPRLLLMLGVKIMRLLDFFGIMPKSMIESDPLYTGAMMANLGSIGLNASLHHIFDWGNMSWCFMVGNYRYVPVANEKGEVYARKMVDIGTTVDERIATGLSYIMGMKTLQRFIENPEELLTPPKLSRTLLDELALVDWEILRKTGKKKPRQYPKEFVID